MLLKWKLYKNSDTPDNRTSETMALRNTTFQRVYSSKIAGLSWVVPETDSTVAARADLAEPPVSESCQGAQQSKHSSNCVSSLFQGDSTSRKALNVAAS